jgi:hypothetical protein
VLRRHQRADVLQDAVEPVVGHEPGPCQGRETPLFDSVRENGVRHNFFTAVCGYRSGIPWRWTRGVPDPLNQPPQGLVGEELCTFIRFHRRYAI